jgi:hypothetical protein
MLIISEREARSYIVRLRNDSSLKVVIGRSLISSYYLNRSNNVSRVSISREVFITLPVVVYTRKDFYLLNSINDGIEHLKATGLIDFWASEGFKRIKSVSRSSHPKVLQVRDFRGSLHLVVFGWIVSVFAVVCECFYKKLNRKRHA